jgi:NAD(P)-dependent dehydrogenase (short-subunit alcohol dehydrogenase family)
MVDGATVADGIVARHGRDAAMSVVFDVSDENDVMRLVATALDRFGRIDVLVNNAALYSTLAPVKCTEIEVAQWDRVMAVNVRGPFLMVKHVAAHMIARRCGKIINISSGTAYKGLPHFLHYVTSKGAVTAFTRALSRELGEYGICVNTLAPGLIHTGRQDQAHIDQTRVAVIQSRALKRDGYPEDLIGALLFLASTDSDFVTGQTIAVDGGSINT